MAKDFCALAPRALLLGAFQAAVDAVSAQALLPGHLPAPPEGQLLVVAAGKAAADMAATAEAHYGADTLLRGLAITRHGHGRPTRSIRVLKAGHPLPDEAGLEGARTLLNRVRSTQPHDHILGLLSGGGSSLLTLPLPGLTLSEVRRTMDGLLRSGAPIAEINCVRKHLSATLGGRLAQASQAPATVLMLSDVVGDDPSVIASGPFAPDPTTFQDALAVLEAWQVAAPVAVHTYLSRGAAGMHPDTPKPGNPCFTHIQSHIIGNGATALAGAAAWLRQRGVTAHVLGDHYTGEARILAHTLAQSAHEACAARPGGQPPMALLSGGEAQVTVRGAGRGGRNGEFLLALALELTQHPELGCHVHALAADTDGIDGSGENAGAVIHPDTLLRATQLGLDAPAYLAANDAWGFFSALSDLVVTGPTRTNANDFRMILLA